MSDFVSNKRVKKPWKPAPNEDYFMCLNGMIVSIPWFTGSIADLGNYAVGNCFRTREEAEAHREEVLVKLKEVYDSGKPLIEVDEI